MPTHAVNTGQEWVPTNPVLGVSRGPIAVMENASMVPGIETTSLRLGQMFNDFWNTDYVLCH